MIEKALYKSPLLLLFVKNSPHGMPKSKNGMGAQVLNHYLIILDIKTFSVLSNLTIYRIVPLIPIKANIA